jgi:RNA recognition motif-containing protein
MFNFRVWLSNVNGTIFADVSAECEEDAYYTIFEEYGEDIEIIECTCTGPAFDKDDRRYGDF